MPIRKILFLMLVCVLEAFGAVKLYLKDGSYQLVREYAVEGDRLKYYSTERSDWEEMPVELADLKRTESEGAARVKSAEKFSQKIEEEAEALREERLEIQKIPTDPGAYMLEDGQLRVLKLAEATIHDDKKRTLLKRLSPIPIVTGKSTLEIPFERSPNALKDDRPEFCLQQSLEDSIGIVKWTVSKNGVRIVERIAVVPVANEIVEERDSVEVFTKQLTESGLYKIWPQEPLPKGEYAVVEYTEGKIDIRVWDFRIE